jgi:hypothetical protein
MRRDTRASACLFTVNPVLVFCHQAKIVSRKTGGMRQTWQ